MYAHLRVFPLLQTSELIWMKKIQHIGNDDSFLSPIHQDIHTHIHSPKYTRKHYINRKENMIKDSFVYSKILLKTGNRAKKE